MREHALAATIVRVRKRFANMALVRWIRSDRYLLLYAIEASQAQAIEGDELHVNTLSDLDLFQQTERWLSREAYQAEAQRRIGGGMRLYTAVTDGVLVHYGWLVPRQKRSWFPYVGQHYDFPEGTAVLFNAYTHPKARGTGLHSRSMRRRIADGASMPGGRWVYTAIESHNKASRAVAARSGFRCVDVLYERIRWGRIARGRMSPDNYFATVEQRV